MPAALAATLDSIERECPGVGREWIRKLLADLKSSGEASCFARQGGAKRQE